MGLYLRLWDVQVLWILKCMDFIEGEGWFSRVMSRWDNFFELVNFLPVDRNVLLSANSRSRRVTIRKRGREGAKYETSGVSVWNVTSLENVSWFQFSELLRGRICLDDYKVYEPTGKMIIERNHASRNNEAMGRRRHSSSTERSTNCVTFLENYL